MKTRKQRGFTMIELVVVMVIIGILAVISVPIYRGYILRARAQEGTALVGSIAAAEKIFYAEYGQYRATAAGVSYDSFLDVRSSENTYFQTYTVTTTGGGTAFTVTTSGTGDGSGITITLIQTSQQPPTLTISGISG